MYTLSAPRHSGFERDFDTAAEARQYAIANFLYTEEPVEVELNGITYLYETVEESEEDRDGAYAIQISGDFEKTFELGDEELVARDEATAALAGRIYEECEDGTVQAEDMARYFPGQAGRGLHSAHTLRAAMIAAGCESAGDDWG